MDFNVLSSQDKATGVSYWILVSCHQHRVISGQSHCRGVVVVVVVIIVIMKGFWCWQITVTGFNPFNESMPMNGTLSVRHSVCVLPVFILIIETAS